MAFPEKKRNKTQKTHRRGAEYAQTKLQSQIRNPKFETLSNDPKRKHKIRSTKLETNSNDKNKCNVPNNPDSDLRFL
jgi:hypothetical protein